MNPSICRPNIIFLEESSSFSSGVKAGRKLVHHQLYSRHFGQQTSVRLDPRGLIKKPKKNLTAYNLFYALERKRILAGTDHLDLPIAIDDLLRIRSEHKTSGKRSHKKKHGLIGFHDLNRIIIKRWKELSRDKKEIFQQQAEEEKEEYAIRLELWEQQERASYGISSFVVSPTSRPVNSLPAQPMHATVSTDSLTSQTSTCSYTSTFLPSVSEEWLKPLMIGSSTPSDLCKPLQDLEMEVLFDDIWFWMKKLQESHNYSIRNNIY